MQKKDMNKQVNLFEKLNFMSTFLWRCTHEGFQLYWTRRRSCVWNAEFSDDVSDLFSKVACNCFNRHFTTNEFCPIFETTSFPHPLPSKSWLQTFNFIKRNPIRKLIPPLSLSVSLSLPHCAERQYLIDCRPFFAVCLTVHHPLAHSCLLLRVLGGDWSQSRLTLSKMQVRHGQVDAI